MNKIEAMMLLRKVRAYCPSQILDDYTPDSWAEILPDVRYEDAEEAIRELGRELEYIGVDDVAQRVKKIRNDRITRHGPILPPAGLTVVEETAWMREATRVVADGGRQENPRGELKARDVAALGLIGRKVPQ